MRDNGNKTMQQYKSFKMSILCAITLVALIFVFVLFAGCGNDEKPAEKTAVCTQNIVEGDASFGATTGTTVSTPSSIPSSTPSNTPKSTTTPAPTPTVVPTDKPNNTSSSLPEKTADKTPKPDKPIWYEQAEIPDVKEIEYTLPADVKFPYYIKVNRAMCCVTVYAIDEKGEYSIPVKAFACSVGKDKPETDEIEQTISGEYQMPQNLGGWWCLMAGNCYSQFAYRIKDGYMFHSVPCYEMNKGTLATKSYNKLGEPDSLGCVRLCVRDAKWICDNCPVGTKVFIYDDASTPGPLGKPDTIKLPIGHKWSGWDPTDPDENNPWRNSSASIQASDVNVRAGEDVDVFKNVKAFDTCGNDITSKMTWFGKYTLDVPGTYNVTFKVTDAIGSKAQKMIKIVVK